MSTHRAVALEMGATGPRARDSSSLASSLTARGFSYDRYVEPRAAFDALLEQPADVLLVDVDSPWLDLREFVEKIRHDPRTARTLLVALASGDPREIPARREIALVLNKPINADEAASRLEALVATRQRAASNTRELKGDLAQLPLPDLLQLLSVSRSVGALAVDSAGRRASLVLDNGELRDVQFSPAAGMKAFVRMMLLTEGAFVFTHGVVGSGAGESMTLGPALFEATRQIDEIERRKASLPDQWSEIRRGTKAVDPATRARIDSSAVLHDVYELLATPRTLAALLDASSFGDAEVLEAIETLRLEGVVDIAGSGSPDRVTVIDANFAAALLARMEDTGRSLSRMLVLTRGTTRVSDASILRALGGLSGFVPAEHSSSGTVLIGPLGMLRAGDVRIELFAVPKDRDLYPLCAVFGATADAAIVVGEAEGPEQVDAARIGQEMGIPVATVAGALSTGLLADGLRSALGQMTPRRQ